MISAIFSQIGLQIRKTGKNLSGLFLFFSLQKGLLLGGVSELYSKTKLISQFIVRSAFQPNLFPEHILNLKLIIN